MSAQSQLEQVEKAYRDYADPLFRFTLLKVKNREKAVDIVQDAFVRACQYIEKGGEVQNWKSFLFKTANNLIIDHYRKKKSDSLDEMTEEGFDIAADTHDGLPILSVDSEKALKAINALDETYRDVVLMRFVEDMQPREIAEVTGLTENVISVRIHRAIEKLRTILHIEL